MTNQCIRFWRLLLMMHLDFFFQTIIVDHGIYPSITMHTRLFQTEPFWIHMKSTIYIVCHLFSKKKIVCHLFNCYFLFFSRGRYYTLHDASVGMGWSWRMDTDHLEYSKAYRLVLSSLSTCGLWETSQRMPRVVQKGFAFIHLSLPSNETAVQHVSLYYDNQSASAPFKKR